MSARIPLGPASYSDEEDEDLKPSSSGQSTVPYTQIQEIKAHTGTVCAIRFNKQGVYAMSCGRDRNIVLWNPRKGLKIKNYEGHGYEVRDVAISSDNNRFASCGGDKQVFLWDVGSATIVRKFTGHDFRINAVKFAAEDQLLVSGGDDKTVKIWDMRAQGGREVQIISNFRDSVTSILVHPEKPEIIAASVDGTIRRFDVRLGHCTTDTVHHAVVHLAQTVDGNCVLAACLDSACRLLDRETGALLGTYRGHMNNAAKLECCLTPSDSHVLCGSEDGRILAWDLETREVVRRLDTGSSAAVVSLTVGRTAGTREPDILVAGQADGIIRVFQ